MIGSANICIRNCLPMSHHHASLAVTSNEILPYVAGQFPYFVLCVHACVWPVIIRVALHLKGFLIRAYENSTILHEIWLVD